MPGTKTVLTNWKTEEVKSITNENSNKLTNSKTNQNYWSPLTSLVAELDENDMFKPSTTFNIESQKEKMLKSKNKNTTVTEHQQVSADMANAVSEMEQEMDKVIADFDQINESIDKIIAKAEYTEIKTETTHNPPSAVYDSGATSGVAAPHDARHLIATGQKSNKIFVIPNSEAMPATDKMKLAHSQLRYPATDMNVVLGVHTSLISACKFADADYITILDKEGPNIYDAKTTKIIISEKAVL